MSTILDRINDLNHMIVSGQIMEALEKHYHPDVIMQDNNLPPCVGKAANIEREKNYMEDLIEFKEAKVLKVCTSDHFSMVEWQVHFTSKSMGEINHNQIAVQTWKDGLIINEHFYYYE